MNKQEREKIIKKLCEKYKMFLVKEFSCVWYFIYFSSEGVVESFMIVDLADMSVKLYKFEFDGSFLVVVNLNLYLMQKSPIHLTE